MATGKKIELLINGEVVFITSAYILEGTNTMVEPLDVSVRITEYEDGEEIQEAEK
jgi:hypothetical protein